MSNDKAKIRADEKSKCTTEQFWAVATFVGVNGFLLARDLVLGAHSSCWIVISVTLLDTYAIVYILLRASAYARLDKQLNNILNERQEDDGVAAVRLRWRDICCSLSLHGPRSW
jgi:uncharacterized membrane protein